MIQIKNTNNKWNFELRPTSGGNIPSTYVHFYNLIEKGLTFGDPALDSIIAAQGKAYSEDGYTEDNTLYRVFNNVTKVEETRESNDEMQEILPEPKPVRGIEIPSFINFKRFV